LLLAANKEMGLNRRGAKKEQGEGRRKNAPFNSRAAFPRTMSMVFQPDLMFGAAACNI